MSKRPRNLTSHTELSKLAQCEMSWHLRYNEGIKGEQSEQAWLGTLVHLGAAAFWRGDDWRVELCKAIAEEGADPALIDLTYFDEGPVASAYWLLQRYERHYADERQDVEVVAQELDLRATIPGTKQVHQAIVDELWRVRGRLWLVERKTYGRDTQVRLAEFSPQLTNNLWVAKANGYDVHGIVFDGIYTYRWKPEKPTQAAMMEMLLADDPRYAGYTQKNLREIAKQEIERRPGVDRPDSESFTHLWLDRSEAHIEAAQAEIRAGIARRNALRRGAVPLRNIGSLCERHCDQRSVCFERLAFPQMFELDAD